MTNQQVIDFLKGLKAVEHFEGFKFSYAIARNIDKAESIVKALKKTMKPTEKYLEGFEVERLKLIKKHVKKDEKGNLIKKVDRETGVFDYDYDDYDKFKEELEVLQKSEKYKEEYDKQKKKYDDYVANLDKPSEKFETFKVDKKEIPEKINAKQLQPILVIIK